MTWNIFSGMHTRNPCVFHLYRVSFRFPRSQQIKHFILLKTLSTLFFALIFCLLYSCFIPSFFYWISKRCSTATHFLFLRHGPATSIVGKRRARLFARILERAIRECERSGAAENPERSESRGQEEGYLTTKSFCLMSVDDAVWNILKEYRKSIREADTTGKRVNREVKGEIRVDTLGGRDGGRSKSATRLRISREGKLRRFEWLRREGENLPSFASISTRSNLSPFPWVIGGSTVAVMLGRVPSVSRKSDFSEFLARARPDKKFFGLGWLWRRNALPRC